MPRVCWRFECGLERFKSLWRWTVVPWSVKASAGVCELYLLRADERDLPLKSKGRCRALTFPNLTFSAACFPYRLPACLEFVTFAECPVTCGEPESHFMRLVSQLEGLKNETSSYGSSKLDRIL